MTYQQLNLLRNAIDISLLKSSSVPNTPQQIQQQNNLGASNMFSFSGTLSPVLLAPATILLSLAPLGQYNAFEYQAP